MNEAISRAEKAVAQVPAVPVEVPAPDPFPAPMCDEATLTARQGICGACQHRARCLLSIQVLPFLLVQCPCGFWGQGRSKVELPSAPPVETVAVQPEASILT